MRNLIPPPPAQGTRYGLLAAAVVLTDGERWGKGAKWMPLPCGPGASGAASCEDMEREGTDPEGEVGADPFYVWASDNCDTFGDLRNPDPAARARTQLELSQGFHIARELWTGAITAGLHPGDQVDPDEAEADVAARSPYLNDEHTEILDPTPAESVDAYKAAESLAYLEQAALTCSAGRRLMLHVPILMLDLLDVAGVVHVDGGLVTTAMGSIVAADPGYPGTGPDNASTHQAEIWLQASTVPTIRLDAIWPPEALDGDATLDRLTNRRTRWAQRLAIYQLDRCCRFAIPTGITRPDFMEV